MASPTHQGEFEQAPADGEGQGSLVGCGPWSHKESDTTERLDKKTNQIKTAQKAGQGFSWMVTHSIFGAEL